MRIKSAIISAVAALWIGAVGLFSGTKTTNNTVVPVPASTAVAQDSGAHVEQFAGAEMWKLVSGNVAPVNSTWGLVVPGLSGVGPGTECVQVSAAGVFSASGAACGTGSGGGSSFNGLGFGLIGGPDVNVTTISFDAGGFNLSNTASLAFIRLDYTNGPASRSMANLWTAVNTFSVGASVSDSLEVAGTASISGATVIGRGLSGSAKALVVNNSTSTGNIFEAQDNGTAVFTIADGGAATFTGLVTTGAGGMTQSSNIWYLAAGLGLDMGGSGTIGGFRHTTTMTPDSPIMYTGTTANAWHIAEFGDVAYDFNNGSAGTSAQTDPTLIIHSRNQSTSQFMEFRHDGSNGVIYSGTGATTVVAPNGGSAKALVANNGTSTGNIFEAQDNGTAVFTVADGGNVTVLQGATIGNSGGVNSKLVLSDAAGTFLYYGGNSVAMGASSLVLTGATNILSINSSGFQTTQGGVVTTYGSSGISGNTFFVNGYNATFQLGLDVNGSPVNQTFKAHDGITGTDVSGANLTIAGGRGTGAGVPGILQFQTATRLGSGTTAQTLSRIGSASQSGWEFSGFASASQTFSSGLSSCTGSNFLQWSSGLFSCAAVSGGSRPASDSLDWDEFVTNMTLDKNHSIASGSGAWALTTRATIKEWDGTGASPSFAFANDTNTGIFRSAADTLNFSTGGVSRLSISTTQIVPGVSLVCTGCGTGGYDLEVTSADPSTPTYTFNGDTNLGFYRIGADILGVAANGTRIASASAAGWEFGGFASVSQFYVFANNSATAPGFAFSNDKNTGITGTGSDVISFVTGGSSRYTLNSTGFTSTSGQQARVAQNANAATSPDFTWGQDSDTGMFNESTRPNVLQFSAGGIRVASGSTSGWELSGTASVSSQVYLAGLTASTGTPNSICQNGTEITVNAALTCTVSSKEFKTKIGGFFNDGLLGSTNSTEALDLVAKLQPRQFAYKDQPNRLRWGFLSEEVSAVDSKLGDAIRPDGHAMSIDIAGLIALNTKAIQEVEQQVKSGVVVTEKTAQDNKPMMALAGAFILYAIYNELDKRKNYLKK